MTAGAAIGLFFSFSALFGGGTEARCEAIVSAPLAGVDVAQSEVVPAVDDLPAYCRVRGVIHPGIGFEARMPISDWNRKYFQSGCGGFCGAVLPDREGGSNAINGALRRGYATLTTDAGHQAAHIGVAEWALDNDLAERQYADESIERAHSAGHTLARALYRMGVRRSYFSGCSNGGRMAAIAAQRYPALFDGIISGCPVLNLSRAGGVFGAWVLQSNLAEGGGVVLDEAFSAKIPLLERAALDQCDRLDGAEDGLIADPFQCNVNLATIPRCESEPTNQCLTDEEAATVARWQRGPENSRSEKLFGGMPAGSERLWAVWYLGAPDAPRVGTMLADGYLKYLGFVEDDPARRAADFDFDRDVARLEAKAALFDATDPDLTGFRDAGGKMIMWHGLADPLVIPDQSVDYFNAVSERMGGVDATQEFFRLFLAPGLGHCWEAPGAGPDDFDPLTALERWVEKGVAPDEMLATRSREQSGIVNKATIMRPYPERATPLVEFPADQASQ